MGKISEVIRVYRENQTENAKRIREWRESKKKGIE